MPSRSIIKFMQFIAIISLLENIVNSTQLLATWEWNSPHVYCIYDIISYDDDLRILCRMTLDTFNYIYSQITEYIVLPRKWMDSNATSSIDYNGKCQSSALGPKDRLLRYYMFNTNHSRAQLEVTFGQNKSIIYADYHYIAETLVFVLGDQWLSLPEPHTDKYKQLIGAGVFSEEGEIHFNNVPYIVDVTTFPICRPKYAQRAYYNGHKKRHTVDFHVCHSGTGRVYSVIGPIPGSHNDIQAAKASLLYKQRNKYLDPDHAVLADLAYFYIGDPFLCRFGFQHSYTAMENAFNFAHSQKRIISENYYMRFKNYWTYLCKPYQMKLETIGITIRALMITTNIIITIQDPLRREWK